MPDENQNNNIYDGSSIQILDGQEAVRKRPSMYIGSTSSRGLHHLVTEILDNSIDEALGGYCNKIDCVINDNGSVTVTDNGRGIPVDLHPVKKIPTLTVILTTLHAGGKFDHKSYQVSGGLHGVGLSVVNSLSELLVAEVTREGRVFTQKFMQGHPVSELTEIKPTDSRRNGTKMTFTPDKTIFEEVIFDYPTIRDRCRELAYLNKNVELTISDERKGKEQKERFLFAGGIIEMVDYLNLGKTYVPGLTTPIYINKGDAETRIAVEVALLYNTGFVSTGNIYTFANNIRTIEGGMHLTGFKMGLTKALNTYGEKKIFKKEEDKIEGEDALEGLIAVLSVKVPDPQFEGQTKTKLGNANVRGITQTIIYDELKDWLEGHPEPAKEIVTKCLKAAQDREKLKSQREALQKARGTGSLPGKLADCSEKDPAKREIFIVEGDSAGGSAKQGRFRETQAVLPLRGKVLNAEKASLIKLLKNREIITIIKALGTGVDQDFDVNSVRYHKIIIMCDADVDGAHIKTLLLTFFFRHMRGLIDAGYIYAAQPPLFKIKKGKKNHYVFDKADLDKVKVDLDLKKEEAIQRFKGLGEMNANELRETTMDPDERHLKKITITDVIEAEAMVSTLMGDNVEIRRKFIEQNAASVDIESLDI